MSPLNCVIPFKCHDPNMVTVKLLVLTSEFLQALPVPTSASTVGILRMLLANLYSITQLAEATYWSDTQATTTQAWRRPSAMSSNRPRCGRRNYRTCVISASNQTIASPLHSLWKPTCLVLWRDIKSDTWSQLSGLSLVPSPTLPACSTSTQQSMPCDVR